MKKLFGSAFALLAIVAFAAPSAVAQNLLTDPSFEDPTKFTADGPPFVGFWESFQGGGASSALSSVDPLTGAGHVALNINNANNTFAGFFQDVAVTGGNLVDFSLYHKTTSLPYNLVSELRIEWRDATTEVGRTPNLTTSPTDSYSLLSLSAPAPGNATFARVVYAIQSFTNTGADLGTVFIDDASVTVVPEPATVALLGMSVIGLAGVRRRR